jgi:hypothetical protein
MVSAAETRSMTPTPRAIGGATRSATRIVNEVMTSNRVAAVSLISGRDPTQALPKDAEIEHRQSQYPVPPVKLRRERQKGAQQARRKEEHERDGGKIDSVPEHGLLTRKGRRFHTPIFDEIAARARTCRCLSLWRSGRASSCVSRLAAAARRRSRPTSGVSWRCPDRRPPPLAHRILPSPRTRGHPLGSFRPHQFPPSKMRGKK